ncbi:signal peptidase II [uncultured Clostridium sp.]|uniref:signal peptidase II n=1 Tax=uncultured Clostridium sp. TaxID=59620 RepID=UPI0025D3CC5F|nr:signal peptidase II [uncultured Clostridium sp.]
MKHTKLLTIAGLPLMWGIYFLFELITGRITELSSFIINLILIFIFIFTGYMLYMLSLNFKNGFSNKKLITFSILFLLIDQGTKIVIKLFFFNAQKEILSKMLFFNPLINTDGSWLNARFGTSISFPILITINVFALFLLFELFRYLQIKGIKDFWSDLTFLFLFIGASCSLIDKIFYGGSLDFIGISNLFVADIKDIYINLGLFAFIVETYNTGYLTSKEESTFKDDIIYLKNFLKFIKNDISNIFK